MKLQNIINQALYEKKDEDENTMKIFYSSDIFLRRTEEQKDNQEKTEVEPEAEEPIEEPEEGEEETAEESSKMKREAYLAEETFRSNVEGVIEVPIGDAKTILTLDDLLAYVNRQTGENGKQIINDLVIEIVQGLSTPGMEEELGNLIFKSDKINTIIDYGLSKEDSIGLQLNKNIGVKDASLVMRQDGRASSGSFRPEMFKTKIASVYLPELKG